jgi:hypothetical protein
MKQYTCFDTGIIKEKDFQGDGIKFCIVKKYDIHYQEQLPRFQKNPLKIYALPFAEVPSKLYLGIGSGGLYECDKKKKFLSKEDMQFVEKLEKFEIEPDEFVDSEEKAIYYLSLFDESDKYDIVCSRVNGYNADVPKEYKFLGYDITYLPCVNGAFSIINDCMFVCMWHGCDEAGTDFLPYFNKLNENGLYNDAHTAYQYMKHYLNFDWSERGEYCICEIYRQK